MTPLRYVTRVGNSLVTRYSWAKIKMRERKTLLLFLYEIVLLTCHVKLSHRHHVLAAHVLIERFFDQVLRFVPGESRHTLVQEDQLQI